MKYNFALPSFELREGYALKWLHKIKKMEKTPSIMFGRGEKEIAKEIARRTGGWSFAFLKELCVVLFDMTYLISKPFSQFYFILTPRCS